MGYAGSEAVRERVARADHRGALRLLEDASRAAPENSELQNDLGAVLFALGDRSGALARFRRACRLDPGNADAAANLADVAALEAEARAPELRRLRERFAAPLVDAGLDDPRFAGIWTPAHYEDDAADAFVHGQFREGAAEYRRRFRSFEANARFLRGPLARAGAPPGAETRIVLDLGSGAGNTILPLLDLFPEALIVASDLSLPMLALLRDELAARGASGRCALLQLNAEAPEFRDGAVDLVVGALVLHHLFDPARTLAEAARVLAPGGAAVFLEPFEEGSMLLSLLFERLLGGFDLSEETRRFLRAIRVDYDARKGSDKSAPRFRRMDDKWLFTRDWIEAAARRAGFSAREVYPSERTDRPLEERLRLMLRRGLGVGPDALPEEAWAEVRRFEETFSEDFRRALLVEGAIVLRK